MFCNAEKTNPTLNSSPTYWSFKGGGRSFPTGHHDQAVRYLYIGAMMDVDAGNELIAKFKESLA